MAGFGEAQEFMLALENDQLRRALGALASLHGGTLKIPAEAIARVQPDDEMKIRLDKESNRYEIRFRKADS